MRVVGDEEPKGPVPQVLYRPPRRDNPGILNTFYHYIRVYNLSTH